MPIFAKIILAQKAIIAGASGLIGGNLLQVLLEEDYYTEVLILVRKEIQVKHLKLKQLVLDFDRLDEYAGDITGHAIFSCLGTTLSQTPDKTVYPKIDYDYPLKLAQLAKQNSVKQFLLVSAVGADASSGNFYLKLKGETENNLKKIGLPALHIYRPSMLTGRKEKIRFAERLIGGFMTVINPFLFNGLSKFKSIAATDVAKAMYNQSIDNETGTHIYQYNEIKQNT